MGFLLSALCSRCPMDMDKPHILAQDAETGFMHLKSKLTLDLKIKYQQFYAIFFNAEKMFYCL
jgi:hypothetical protein